MRILCISALVAIGAGGIQPQPVPDEVTVIVDSDGPVANAEASARLRAHALSHVERYGRPVYFDLTANSISPVADDASDSFRGAAFTFHPPRYAGVSLSFDEASEILRKNEAVRDVVIRRECSMSPRECGAAVHAAATTLVADTEAASGRKLRQLVDTAISRRPAILMLVTAGWPYRDESRVRLDAAVRELQAAGTRLVVLRVPALVAYRGLVRDASESVASRLSAPFVELNDERDAERAHYVLGKHDHTAPAASVAVPEVTPVVIEPPLPEEAPVVSDLSDDSLRRAAVYVARFERTFSAVIWRERYLQEDRVRRRFNASGTSFTRVAGRRQLDSELLFIWLPRDASWIAVRDVMAIDGKPRPAGDRGLQALLAGPEVSVGQLRQLAAENGRFNIGQIRRTFNEPTLALLFLDEHYRHRFAFARSGAQTVNGRRVATYDFVERARPTVIQDHDRDLPVRGTLRIDETTGQVLHTLLELADPSGRLSGRMTVQYGPAPRFDVLVPVEMRETYSSASGEEVSAVATYSDFRRFETGGRLIVPE